MPLPRNLISRNKNIHTKEGINKIINKKKFELDKICIKHKICQLSFGPCKLINTNGSISNIEYQNIKCNMKSSIIIMQIKSMTQNNDNIYDLIEIEKNKLLNDMKRQEETIEKTQLELERNLTNENKINEQTDEITNKSEDKNLQNELKESSQAEQITDVQEKSSQNDNRYYRRFMDDIKKKFSLRKENMYRYFEIKSSSTDFVIENPKTYIINLSNDSNINYLLVIGDLMLKSKLILKIDPGYKSEKIYKEHNEFFNRIKEKENKN